MYYRPFPSAGQGPARRRNARTRVRDTPGGLAVGGCPGPSRRERYTTRTTPAATTTYYSNELNQYHRSRRFVSSQTPLVAQGFRHDEDGNLAETFISGDMNCDGVINFDDINVFVLAISDPAGYHQQYPNCNILNGDINGDGVTDIGDVNAFVTLAGHGAGGVGLRSEYLWDAENRLIEVRPTDGTQAYGDKKVKFWYDYLGRCVQKEVQTWTAGSPDDYVVTEQRKFMYYGWLPILELDGLSSDMVVRAYTWGLDLAAQNAGPSRDRQGAGPAGHAGFGAPALQGLAGVGGLLAVHQAQTGAPNRDREGAERSWPREKPLPYGRGSDHPLTTQITRSRLRSPAHGSDRPLPYGRGSDQPVAARIGYVVVSCPLNEPRLRAG